MKTNFSNVLDEFSELVILMALSNFASTLCMHLTYVHLRLRTELHCAVADEPLLLNMHVFGILAREVCQTPAINHGFAINRLHYTESHYSIHPVIRAIARSLKRDMRKVLYFVLDKPSLARTVLEIDSGSRSEDSMGLDKHVVSVVSSNGIHRVELVVDLGGTNQHLQLTRV